MYYTDQHKQKSSELTWQLPAPVGFHVSLHPLLTSQADSNLSFRIWDRNASTERETGKKILGCFIKTNILSQMFEAQTRFTSETGTKESACWL